MATSLDSAASASLVLLGERCLLFTCILRPRATSADPLATTAPEGNQLREKLQVEIDRDEAQNLDKFWRVTLQKAPTVTVAITQKQRQIWAHSICDPEQPQ